VLTGDRLRRLDALFAERVLGCKVKWWQRAKGDKLEPGCRCNSNSPHGSTDGHGDMDPALAEFTRSLDAAWEGVGNNEIQLGTLPHGKGWRCYYNPDWQCSGADFTTEADHPAEALVLACLKAIGCTEEDLT